MNICIFKWLRRAFLAEVIDIQSTGRHNSRGGKMKEIILGIIIAAVLFMAIKGINVIPVVVMLIIAGGLYYLLHAQGLLKVNNIGAAYEKEAGLHFKDIGGQDSAVNELKEALEFLLKPEHIVNMGIRPLKGVLLIGPQEPARLYWPCRCQLYQFGFGGFRSEFINVCQGRCQAYPTTIQ